MAEALFEKLICFKVLFARWPVSGTALGENRQNVLA
jgi:hypothetical protein